MHVHVPACAVDGGHWSFLSFLPCLFSAEFRRDAVGLGGSHRAAFGENFTYSPYPYFDRRCAAVLQNPSFFKYFQKLRETWASHDRVVLKRGYCGQQVYWVLSTASPRSRTRSAIAGLPQLLISAPHPGVSGVPDDPGPGRNRSTPSLPSTRTFTPGCSLRPTQQRFVVCLHPWPRCGAGIDITVGCSNKNPSPPLPGGATDPPVNARPERGVRRTRPCGAT